MVALSKRHPSWYQQRLLRLRKDVGYVEGQSTATALVPLGSLDAGGNQRRAWHIHSGRKTLGWVGVRPSPLVPPGIGEDGEAVASLKTISLLPMALELC